MKFFLILLFAKKIHKATKMIGQTKVPLCVTPPPPTTPPHLMENDDKNGQN